MGDQEAQLQERYVSESSILLAAQREGPGSLAARTLDAAVDILSEGYELRYKAYVDDVGAVHGYCIEAACDELEPTDMILWERTRTL